MSRRSTLSNETELNPDLADILALPVYVHICCFLTRFVHVVQTIATRAHMIISAHILIHHIDLDHTLPIGSELQGVLSVI